MAGCSRVSREGARVLAYPWVPVMSESVSFERGCEGMSKRSRVAFSAVFDGDGLDISRVAL
jgi:hypothetical protein